jgi:hypothetical protein
VTERYPLAELRDLPPNPEFFPMGRLPREQR